MFSDLLGNLPVSHLTVVSYQDLKQQKDVKITETPKVLKNERLLVVDEIDDTGKTLKIIKEYLRSLNIKKYYTLAPIIRSFSNPKPDFYLKVIDDWIIYPYEIKETYEAFLKLFKTKNKVIKELQNVGFSKKQVSLLK
jgi:hypoxanthine phosphoribosyltransferase